MSQEPIYTCDVEIPKGECLRIGVVNPLDGWGKEGGVQFDTIGKRIGDLKMRENCNCQ